jgi:hypothetical protein
MKTNLANEKIKIGTLVPGAKAPGYIANPASRL